MLLRLMDAIRREKPALWTEIRQFAAKREKGALEEFLLLDEFLPAGDGSRKGRKPKRRRMTESELLNTGIRIRRPARKENPRCPSRKRSMSSALLATGSISIRTAAVATR
jgi:hypothetical protein